MLKPGLRTPPTALRGHTLSELLIASAIGIFILGGLLHVYAQHTGAARHLLAEARLQRALGEAA
jgi:Tfp pilus assembly protein PilW